MVRGKRVAESVSFDINPASRQDLEELSASGGLGMLISAGARLHQAGCNGCIGMGQAPATGRNSLRTTPRNFPGRSGTREDSVYLCSPETATAAALTGVITDPRDLGLGLSPSPPRTPTRAEGSAMLVAPPPLSEARKVTLNKGPNITHIPELEPLSDDWSLPVIAAVGDDVSTDEILPAGARVLPFRSNIQRISEFAFETLLPDYVDRAKELREEGGHVLVAGENYGQGSSREHAALAARYLGLRVVLARSYARIHRKNLVNFGVLPLRLVDDKVPRQGDRLETSGLYRALRSGRRISLHNATRNEAIEVEHDLEALELEWLTAGSVLSWLGERQVRQRHA
jgi:aconitate hydratase